MSLFESGETWIRQTFAWSNSWPSWRERLVVAAFVLVAALLTFLSLAFLPVWVSLILWALYALALAICSRQGWLKLFGPVLFYDMVRTARRSRYSIIRILYGGFLFLIFSYMTMLLFLAPRMMGQPLQARDTAVLAEAFFATFMIVQIVLVVILTPAYVAGAVAEEKDRKTLEFLLATDLDNREIILSKLLSRLANMTLLLITGLPILSILQLIGGVDPELVLAGFAGVGLTMLGIAGISILLSTLFKKPRDAISLTYLLMLAYVSLSSFLLIFQSHPLLQFPLWFGDDPPRLVDWLNAGNPITAISDIVSAINGGRRGGARTTLAEELPIILTRYAWFHLTLSFLCVGYSILRVRAIGLRQTTAGTTAQLRWWHGFRPSVGHFPMLWKELFIEGRTRFNWLVWAAVLVLVALTLGTGLYIAGNFLWDIDLVGLHRRWEDLFMAMNIWFRIVGTFVGCLTLLMIGVRAATSITSEIERDTFDSLIATPMGAQGMLLAKVVGNMASLKPAWFWFGSLLLLALVTGGLHPLAVPLILGAWLIYALFVTMLGLMFSMFCRSSMWSVLSTVLTTLVLGGGHWVVTSCCCMPIFGMAMMMLNRQGLDPKLEKIGEYFLKFQAGMTPPVVFAWCSTTWNDPLQRESVFWEVLLFSLLGLFLWLTASIFLWFAILVPKFKQLARRNELEYD